MGLRGVSLSREEEAGRMTGPSGKVLQVRLTRENGCVGLSPGPGSSRPSCLRSRGCCAAGPNPRTCKGKLPGRTLLWSGVIESFDLF